MKRCEACGQVKPEEEFSKSYKNRCKECVSNMARFKRNSTKKVLRLKASYEAPNPEIDVIVKELKESVKNRPKNMTKDEEIAFIMSQSNKSINIDLIDWEQRKYELAKAAMQGYCANSDTSTFPMEDIAIQSIGMAEEMIKRMIGG